MSQDVQDPIGVPYRSISRCWCERFGWNKKHSYRFLGGLKTLKIQTGPSNSFWTLRSDILPNSDKVPNPTDKVPYRDLIGDLIGTLSGPYRRPYRPIRWPYRTDKVPYRTLIGPLKNLQATAECHIYFLWKPFYSTKQGLMTFNLLKHNFCSIKDTHLIELTSKDPNFILFFWKKNDFIYEKIFFLLFWFHQKNLYLCLYAARSKEDKRRIIPPPPGPQRSPSLCHVGAKNTNIIQCLKQKG